jgi:hypothetical protein
VLATSRCQLHPEMIGSMSIAATAAAPPRSLGDAMAARLREASIVVIGSAIAGALVGGIGSRLVMRVAAIAAPGARGSFTENGNVVGEITLAGTIGLIVLASLGSAIFGAGAYIVARPWLPRGVLARGLLFGGFVLVLMGTTAVDPRNSDFVILGDPLLSVAMFSALFVAFGVTASGAMTLLEERVPPAAALSPRMWALTAIGALPILPGLAGVALGFAPELGVPLVGAWTGMTLSNTLDRRERHGLAVLIRAGATAGMLVIVGLAGADYVDGVMSLL